MTTALHPIDPPDFCVPNRNAGGAYQQCQNWGADRDCRQCTIGQAIVEKRVAAVTDKRRYSSFSSFDADRAELASGFMTQMGAAVGVHEAKRCAGVDVLPSTGRELRSFGTGAVRDNVQGKGAYHLLMPRAIHQLARRLEQGALKYAARNWEKGIPMSAFVDSGLRHLFQFMAADDGTEDHLAASAWNLMACLETRERIKCGVLPDDLMDIGRPQ